MKKLVKELVEIASAGIIEQCVIKIENKDEKYINANEFIKVYKDKLKNFEVIQCSHNDLMMRWEIRVMEVENVSK